MTDQTKPRATRSATSLGAAHDLGKSKAAPGATFLGWTRLRDGIMAGRFSDGTVVYRDRRRRMWVGGKE